MTDIIFGDASRKTRYSGESLGNNRMPVELYRGKVRQFTPLYYSAEFYSPSNQPLPTLNSYTRTSLSHADQEEELVSRIEQVLAWIRNDMRPWLDRNDYPLAQHYYVNARLSYDNRPSLTEAMDALRNKKPYVYAVNGVALAPYVVMPDNPDTDRCWHYLYLDYPLPEDIQYRIIPNRSYTTAPLYSYLEIHVD